MGHLTIDAAAPDPCPIAWGMSFLYGSKSDQLGNSRNRWSEGVAELGDSMVHKTNSNDFPSLAQLLSYWGVQTGRVVRLMIISINCL